MSVAFSTDAAFVETLESARSIRLSAYVLRTGSPVVEALERAASGGAGVDVVLEGLPHARGAEGALARANAAVAADLRACGATVRLTQASEEPMHMKAAVVDGTTYLDDRNWTTGEHDALVVTTDAEVARTVGEALSGRPTRASASFAVEKRDALRLEAEAIAAAPGDRIDVETESFGATEMSVALRDRARSGSLVRLLVSPEELRGPGAERERNALASLAAAGVQIETSAANEKLCVAGGDAWVGSANATYSPRPIADWGLRTRDPAFVASRKPALRAELDGRGAVTFPAAPLRPRRRAHRIVRARWRRCLARPFRRSSQVFRQAALRCAP